MRLTNTVYKFNIIRRFKLRWEQIKRRKAPLGKDYLFAKNLGLPTVPAEDFLKAAEEEVVPIETSDVKPAEPLNKKILFDENHPLYKSEPCYCINDTKVLLEGLNQAKLLLNTVELQEGLPKSQEDLIGTRAIPFQDTRVKRTVMNANVYDALQVVLPRIKDPTRPAVVLPRVYGIDSKRRFQLTITQMLQLCSLAGGHSSLGMRTHVENAYCSPLLEKEDCPIQIHCNADVLVTSKDPLPPLTTKTEGNNIPLPDIHPMKFTVSIPKEHFYHSNSIYPLHQDFPISYPHTAFFHFDPTEVKNLYEEPVTDSQFLSRTLVKAFAVAASKAQQLFGEDVKQLPEPLTLQVVHTDHQKFHFAILQLNTLDLNGTNSQRNIFMMHPQPIELFSTCAYVKGRPVLEGYNPEVFQRVLAFYCNGLP